MKMLESLAKLKTTAADCDYKHFLVHVTLSKIVLLFDMCLCLARLGMPPCPFVHKWVSIALTHAVYFLSIPRPVHLAPK
jgi:hypothetical protein